MGKYDDVIERLTKADGPSLELDGHVWVNANPDDLLLETAEVNNQGEVLYDGPGFAYARVKKAPAYTASLDAAIALTEKLLPGWHPFIGRNVHHGYWLCGVQRVNDAMPDGVEKFSGQHDFNSPAIALLFGAFRALQAQDRE